MPANLGNNFYPKLVRMCRELGMRPEDLISVMISESGMNPSAHNPGGGASGLIQFMPFVLKGLGFPGSPDDFRKLSGEQQLPWIKKLIKGNMALQGGKPFTSGGQYYVSNLWPVALKLPGVKKGDPNTVILEKNPEGVRVGEALLSKKYLNVGSKISVRSEQSAYDGNPIFDKEKKGYITLGDLNRQVNQNKHNPIYRKTLLSMNEATGYTPEKTNQQPPSMLAHTDTSSMEGILNKYVQMLSATAGVSIKRLYKKALQNNDILIQIKSSDYTSAIEFSRILCSALDEDLLSTSYTHTDGRDVEVECSIPGPEKECFAAVQQMSETVAEVFKDATSKIGGITVNISCLMNKKSSYHPISLKNAGTNYRTFLLKFL